MKKADEMDRSIRLRSEEIGFKIAVLALAAWTLFECWRKLTGNAAQNQLPVLILVGILCAQGFSELAMKRRMSAGDEEYKEPNQFLGGLCAALAVTAIVLTVGATIFLSLH